MESDDSELDEFNIRDDKNAIAKAKRGRKKHSKRRIRVESSSDHESESAESESPKSYRHKPPGSGGSGKYNRQSPKFSSVSQEPDSHSEIAFNQQHITLEMALGSPGDGPDEDDDDEEESESEKQDPEPSKQGRSRQLVSSMDRNQFASSRRISNQTLSPNNKVVPSSPSGSDWSQPAGHHSHKLNRPTHGDQVFISPFSFSYTALSSSGLHFSSASNSNTNGRARGSEEISETSFLAPCSHFRSSSDDNGDRALSRQLWQ
jgi:hypothetical protein